MNLLERILVPVDIESNDFFYLEQIIPLAKGYDSKIYLLYVLPQEIMESETKDLAIRLVENELQKIGETYYTPQNIRFEKVVEFGKVYETIAYIGDLYDINLIVMSANSKSNPNQFSIRTERVIRESEIAVLAVKRNHPLEFKHIICPVDFSDPSLRALTNAARLAKFFNSKLTVFHCKEEAKFPKFLDFGKSKTADEEEELGIIREQVNLFAEKAGLYAYPFESVVKKGIVHEEIAKYVTENQVSVLIMGISGSGGLKRILLGSVTEKIMMSLPCHLIVTETLDILEAKLSQEIQTLETHFKLAESLERSNFLHEAIGELKICLHINDLHLPSYHALIRIYKKLGDDEKALEYQRYLDKILDLQEKKAIEEEIRRNFFFGDNK